MLWQAALARLLFFGCIQVCMVNAVAGWLPNWLIQEQKNSQAVKDLEAELQRERADHVSWPISWRRFRSNNDLIIINGPKTPQISLWNAFMLPPVIVFWMIILGDQGRIETPWCHALSKCYLILYCIYRYDCSGPSIFLGCEIREANAKHGSTIHAIVVNIFKFA